MKRPASREPGWRVSSAPERPAAGTTFARWQEATGLTNTNICARVLNVGLVTVRDLRAGRATRINGSVWRMMQIIERNPWLVAEILRY